MFKRLVTHKSLKAKTMLFDSWYGSVDNLKLIHRAGWTFFTTLKSNRLVSLSRETGYQHLQELEFDDHSIVKGLIVKLKECPFTVKLFKMVAPNGDIDWIITAGRPRNDPDHSVNLFVAEIKNDNRWQVEEFHRAFKQLTGSEKCQCRKARSQRNHLACCYHAWVSLKVKAKQINKSVYQVRKDMFSDYLVYQLMFPSIQIV